MKKQLALVSVAWIMGMSGLSYLAVYFSKVAASMHGADLFMGIFSVVIAALLITSICLGCSLEIYNEQESSDYEGCIAFLKTCWFSPIAKTPVNTSENDSKVSDNYSIQNQGGA